MAARKGNNLLGQALRIAQPSGRSHQVRLGCLLRLAARIQFVCSASIYLPDPKHTVLAHRFSTLLPVSSRNCLIPYGEGCAGLAASTLARQTASAASLHPDEPSGSEEKSFLAIPVLAGRKLVAVLSLGSAEAAFPKEGIEQALLLAPVFALTLAGIASAQEAEQGRRNLSLLASLGQLLSTPQPRGTLLPQLMKLYTASGLSRCAVIRLNEREGQKLRLIRSSRREARDILAKLQPEEVRLSARTLEAGATCTEELPLKTPYRYLLCTPLGSDGNTLGTMTLIGGAEVVAPDQVELAETVARLLSGALAEAICKEQIQCYNLENDKKLKELSLLYRMSNTMLSTIKLNKLIHLTLTALTSGPTPFFDRAMLYLSNERSGMLVGMLGVTCETAPPLPLPHGGSDDILSSRWDISEQEMEAQRESDFCRQVQGKRLELDVTLNIASQAVLEKRLIYLPEESDSGAQARGGRTALAASPLIAHGKAVGAVLVDNALSRAPITQEHLRFLQLFTNQAGMAIENSMLYNTIEDAHRQLSEAQENLLQKERLAAIGEMAAGIAHELKGPLVSIGGFAGRLARKLPQESNEWAHADLIVREVLRLEGILSEILLFSKKTTICYNKCNIVDIVKDSLAVVAPPLEEKRITVNTKFPRQKFVLLGDGPQLKQVFINIILNALDAMGEGGTLAVQVSTTDLDGKEAACVKIADTGGGIPLEQLNSIFTPFFTTKEGGTGLGLPIANRIITNHGGKIQITNTPGLGVEFRVVLPKQW